VEDWLVGSPLPGMVLWVVLYISDYYLTLKSARGFKEIGHFQFEKSFELTPQFQRDIDGNVRISKRHITYLIIYTLVILFLWWLSVSLLKVEWLYSFYLGMFLLLETAVHLRHLRNLYMIGIIKKEGGVDGEITYHQRFSYKISANEFNLLAALFLITAIITFSPFFFGGAVMCFGTGIRHNRHAERIIKTQQEISADTNADHL
jgi:hypothetical protein